MPSSFNQEKKSWGWQGTPSSEIGESFVAKQSTVWSQSLVPRMTKYANETHTRSSFSLMQSNVNYRHWVDSRTIFCVMMYYDELLKRCRSKLLNHKTFRWFVEQEPENQFQFFLGF